jgi:hypothetical protein
MGASDRPRPDRPRRPYSSAAGNITIRDTRPSARARSAHEHSANQSLTAAKYNHRTTRTESRRKDRPIPRLGYSRKARSSFPSRMGTPSEESPQNFFRSPGRIESGIPRRIVVKVAGAAGVAARSRSGRSPEIRYQRPGIIRPTHDGVTDSARSCLIVLPKNPP